MFEKSGLGRLQIASLDGGPDLSKITPRQVQIIEELPVGHARARTGRIVLETHIVDDNVSLWMRRVAPT